MLWSTRSYGLHVHAGRERVLLDEHAARLNVVAHQLVEDRVGFVDLLDGDLKQRTGVDVKRRLPKLLRVHLAQALVALQGEALAAGRHHSLDQAHRTVKCGLLLLAPQLSGPGIDLLQRSRVLVEPARLGRAKQRLVDDGGFLDAAHHAFEMKAVALLEAALPAALGLVRQHVEAARDILRGLVRLRPIVEDARPQHARDRGLLDQLAIVTAVQAQEQAADRARLLDQAEQIGAAAVLAGGEPQHRVLKAGLNEVVLKRALILQILLGPAARHLVERRLRDEQMTAIDETGHLPDRKSTRLHYSSHR